MRVLVADTFEQSGLDALKALGCEVLDQPNLTDQLLPDAVRDLQADVLVVRSTQVLAAVFAAPRSNSSCGQAPDTTRSTWWRRPNVGYTSPTARGRTPWQSASWHSD